MFPVRHLSNSEFQYELELPIYLKRPSQPSILHLEIFSNSLLSPIHIKYQSLSHDGKRRGTKASSWILQKEVQKEHATICVRTSKGREHGLAIEHQTLQGCLRISDTLVKRPDRGCPLEDDLCQGFATVYGYTVEKYRIDATLSHYDTRKEFRKRLQKFTDDYNKQGNLLIVVYSGHAAHLNSSGQNLLA